MRKLIIQLSVLASIGASSCHEKQDLLQSTSSSDARSASTKIDAGRCDGGYRSCPFPKDPFGNTVAMAGIQMCGVNHLWEECVPRCEVPFPSWASCFPCLKRKCLSLATQILCTKYRGLYCDRFACTSSCQLKYPGCKDPKCKASIDACITQCGLDVVCSKYTSLDCDLMQCAQKCDQTSCAPDFAPACLDKVVACKAQCEAQYPTPYSQIQKCAVDPAICGLLCSGANVAMEASSVCGVKPLPEAGVQPPDRGVNADLPVPRDLAPDKPPADR